MRVWGLGLMSEDWELPGVDSEGNSGYVGVPVRKSLLMSDPDLITYTQATKLNPKP